MQKTQRDVIHIQGERPQTKPTLDAPPSWTSSSHRIRTFLQRPRQTWASLLHPPARYSLFSLRILPTLLASAPPTSHCEAVLSQAPMPHCHLHNSNLAELVGTSKAALIKPNAFFSNKLPGDFFYSTLMMAYSPLCCQPEFSHFELLTSSCPHPVFLQQDVGLVFNIPTPLLETSKMASLTIHHFPQLCHPNRLHLPS